MAQFEGQRSIRRGGTRLTEQFDMPHHTCQAYIVRLWLVKHAHDWAYNLFIRVQFEELVNDFYKSLIFWINV